MKPTVMVVDDNPVNIELMVGVLESRYHVVAVKSGEKALSLARRLVKPDIILLDVMMPDMDGYELCRELKKDHRTKHIPVIFVSAKSETEDEVKGFKIGAVDYIAKPISPALVLARVRTHLALYDQNRELDRRVRLQTEELYQTRLRVIQRLGRAAEYKDNETGLHVIRMSHYSRILALAVGMAEDAAEMLMNAAPMHDVGKIGIPDAILRKPGPLTDEEWTVMRTHTEIGAQIIGHDSCDLLSMAAVVALTHHEKWDGSGYPRGLAGEEIPLVGRIVAVADVFDALTSKRPYKDAWPVDRAVANLEAEAGHHFDPALVDAFLGKMPDILEIKRRFEEA